MLTLKRYWSFAEASLAKTLLEDYEIFCVFFDENVHALGYYFVFPLRLMVADRQFEHAARILSYAETSPVPTDEDAPADDRAAVRRLPESIFGHEETRQEPVETAAGRNNPWEILAVAYAFLVPGIGFLVEKVPIMFFVGGRRGNRWITLSPLDVHFLGAAFVGVAILLTISYFSTRRAIAGDDMLIAES